MTVPVFISEENQIILNNIEGVLNVSKDQWVIDFCNSISLQIKSGRDLTDRQKEVFNKNFKKTFPSLFKKEPIQLSEDSMDFLNKADTILAKTKDKWFIDFINNLKHQVLELGNELTLKQLAVFNEKYDKKMAKYAKKQNPSNHSVSLPQGSYNTSWDSNADPELNPYIIINTEEVTFGDLLEEILKNELKVNKNESSHWGPMDEEDEE